MTIRRDLSAVCLTVCCVMSGMAVSAAVPEVSQVVIEKSERGQSTPVANESVEGLSEATKLSADKKSDEKDQSAPSFAFNPASTANRSSEFGSGVVTTNPLSVVGGLLAVVLLIFFLAWLMRRVAGIPTMGGQQMKVVAALAVGAREKIVLVDVGGQQILVGVAAGRVSHLQSFEQPVLDSPVGNSDFSSAMKKILQNNQTSAAGKKGPQ